MSIPKQILLSILVVLLAAGGWYVFDHRDTLFGDGAAMATGESSGGAGRGGAGSFGRGGQVPVVTARVGIDTIGPQIRAIGTLEAANAVTLYPEVTGVVIAVEVEPGAAVSQGQVLVRLEDADQEVAIDRAQIALEDARAALGRAERLAETNNVSEVAVSDARTVVRAAEIDLRSAEVERNKRIITAPFAGFVGLIPVSAGDLVNTSTALTTLDDVSYLSVVFDAPERFVSYTKVGHPVSGSAIGAPGRDISGEISAVDSRVDPATRVFRIEAKLEEGIEDLKPGMSIVVSVDFEGEPRATVPSLAIQWDREGSFVWTLDGDTGKRTPVQIVGRRTGTVVVAGNISPGTEVVTEGLQRMREGIAVERVGVEPAAAGDALSSEGENGGEPAATAPGRTG